MKNKIIAALLAIFFTTQISFAASPFSANAKTKRIPAGTEMSLRILNSIDTSINGGGTNFNAVLLTDQKENEDIILPMGSIVRGEVKAVIPAKRFSKGSVLYLDFDHVVTPNGRQIPLTLNVIGRRDMTADGGITTTKGYADAWKQTCVKSGHITLNAIDWADDVTDNGFRYVLIPIGAIGGAFGTAGYFIYDSIADMIRKGKDVRINKDEILNVILVEPVDVPVI